MYDRNRIVRIANLLAGIVGLIVAVLVPIGYYTISYKYTTGNLEAETEINSRLFSSLISRNPELWQFEETRLEELLTRRPGKGYKEIRRIVDTHNRVIAESTDPLRPPLITWSCPIKDSGTTVARIEISRSMRPILLTTALIACFGIFTGLIIFVFMRIIPFRAVIKAEEALRDSEEHYRSLFNNMLNGFAYCRVIFEKDQAKDFIYLKVNKAFEDLTGLKDVAGKKGSEVTPGINELDPELIEIYGRVALTGKPATFEFYSKSMSMWFSISAYSPVKEHFVAIFDVIGERKKAEESLRESERRHRELFEGAPVGIFTCNSNGRPIVVNPAMARLLGFDSPEKALEHSADLAGNPFVCSERRDEFLRMLRESGHVEGFEYQTSAADDRDIWLSMNASVAERSENSSFIIEGFVTDITERKRAEEDRKKLETQLLQAQKMESVGRLAGGVAHDFNNMLSVIIGHAELALSNSDSEEPVHDNLQEIFEAAKRSADITRQLLAFARKQTIDPKVLNLNETVEGMLKMLRRLIGEDIDLAWHPDTNIWPVKMDPAQVNQILANLCVNARDAIAGVGKITIETENVFLDEDYCSEHEGFLPGEFVMLAVSDDGSGMEKGTLASVFEPFYTTKGLGKGTGLGLSTVYGIVKQNEGFINVYSEPGKGSTFKIYLLRHSGEAATITEEASDQMPQSRGETILVVEDESAVLDLARRVLEKSGYTVLAAAGPSEAIALTQGYPGEIHLLLTDVVMPEMGGKDLARRIAESLPNIKILFMSGYTSNAIVHHGILYKGINFIQKPLTRDSLTQKVRAVLDKN
jgi:two-component system, cell cycle sensor histidine kinase and response regulator CckA